MHVIASSLVMNMQVPAIISVSYQSLFIVVLPRFFSQRCLKEGSVEDKTPVDSPFDLFNNNNFFHWKK